jgi:hypothetical protein
MPFITAGITALATAATALTATTAATTAAAAGTAAGATATAGGLAGAASTIGTIGSIAGTVGGAYYQRQSAAAQQEQEALRMKQMNLESDRARREVIRKSQVQQAIGLNNAAQSGGELSSSSAAGGIIGQAQGNAQYETTAINQNQAIGQQMFAANVAESNANSNASLFKSAGEFGGTLVKNNMEIGRIGATLFGRT